MTEQSIQQDQRTTSRSSSVVRGKNVTAVLGPTNTGKTHLAIERMLGHQSGLIGLPLRLLAREVYDKIVSRIGPNDVALITGEERIKPPNPKYFVCTVEAMPRDHNVDFLAIDEIQLAADPERGHVFTDRLLHERGNAETLLLGAATMREAVTDLLPGTNHISRPRLSKLTYAGQKKITRLPRRTAIVAFSSNEVYEIAELIRRQRGGAAVVLGALSPRTRNAQVELYQSGDVDFIVATDAIGMGLNLDVDHVAFAGSRKFDGQLHRELKPSEISQIAGRAGRHLNDGTFGVTANVEPFGSDLVNCLEAHQFEPVKMLQWRNRKLDFSSLEHLRESLNAAPTGNRLTRARMSDDVIALENVSADNEIRRMAKARAALRKLWDVCQIPDYRKISVVNHAELIASLYKYLMSDTGHIPEDWFAKQVELANNATGDIDTLANRIAHIRTWTFVSNKTEWLADPAHWQERTREVEDKLSDALHERLIHRFVDQRTSVLMRRLRDEDELYAEISDDGSVHVEKHFVGRLNGFLFTPDAKSEGIHGKAARHAASQVLIKELSMRTRRITSAKNDAFSFTSNARILWRGEEIARLEASDDPLRPVISVVCDDQLTAPDREKIQNRLETWLADQIQERLKPLWDLSNTDEISGLARGIAFRLTESFGILKREDVAEEIRSLDQTTRSQLRKFGIRFGAFNIYFPILLKPASSELLLLLWSLKTYASEPQQLNDLPEPPRAGLTSFPAASTTQEGFYRAAGFHLCDNRAVRIDMLERLADMIRPLVAWRSSENSSSEKPAGTTGDGGFTVQPDMMSIMGCSSDELGTVLRSLGFRLERKKVKIVKIENAEKSENSQADKTVSATSEKTPPQDAKILNENKISEKHEEVSAGSHPEEIIEEIWRPRKRKIAYRKNQAGVQAKRQNSKNAKQHSRPRNGKNAIQNRKSKISNTDQRKPVSRKTIDPDSPFAALSKLKKELEDQLPKN